MCKYKPFSLSLVSLPAGLSMMPSTLRFTALLTRTESSLAARRRRIRRHCILCAFTLRHTNVCWLLLTVLFKVGCWSEDVQIIVQTSLVETRLVRLCVFFPVESSTVKTHLNKTTHNHTRNDIIKPPLVWTAL